MSKVSSCLLQWAFSHYLQFSHEKKCILCSVTPEQFEGIFEGSLRAPRTRSFHEIWGDQCLLCIKIQNTWRNICNRRNALSSFQKAARCWGTTWDWRKQMELLHDTRQRPNSGSFQLLVWSLKLSSCDLRPPSAAALRLNKVSVQAVVFTLLSAQVGGDDLWRVRVMLGVLKCGLVRKWWVVNRYHVTTNY